MEKSSKFLVTEIQRIFWGFAKVSDYQNNNVKHNENYNEIEVDFIFEQTAVLMRLLIKLDNKKKTT